MTNICTIGIVSVFSDTNTTSSVTYISYNLSYLYFTELLVICKTVLVVMHITLHRSPCVTVLRIRLL